MPRRPRRPLVVLFAALAIGCTWAAIIVDAAFTASVLIVGALVALGALLAEVRGRAHRPTISSIVITGLAFVGLYLGVAGISGRGDEANPPVSRDVAPLATAIADGDIAKIRNETRRSDYSDPAVAAPKEKLRYQLLVKNISGKTLEGVRVRLIVQSPLVVMAARPPAAGEMGDDRRVAC